MPAIWIFMGKFLFEIPCMKITSRLKRFLRFSYKNPVASRKQIQNDKKSIKWTNNAMNFLVFKQIPLSFVFCSELSIFKTKTIHSFHLKFKINYDFVDNSRMVSMTYIFIVNNNFLLLFGRKYQIYVHFTINIHTKRHFLYSVFTFKIMTKLKRQQKFDQCFCKPKWLVEVQKTHFAVN